VVLTVGNIVGDGVFGIGWARGLTAEQEVGCGG
jgi:hypothetical protein